MSAVNDLLDRVDGLTLIIGILRADVGRLSHELACQCDHRPGHGCREEHHVAIRGNTRKQGLDVGEEAKVKHLVGLVKDNVLYTVQVQHALTQQVNQASGGTDNDIRSSVECLNLRFKSNAAVDVDDAR